MGRAELECKGSGERAGTREGRPQSWDEPGERAQEFRARASETDSVSSAGQCGCRQHTSPWASVGPGPW